MGNTKKLGILGGMGPESTLMYYKLIVAEFQKQDDNNYFPELTIETVNMYKMLDYCNRGDYDNLANYLLKGIKNLEKAGADFVVLASNTPHVVFDELEKNASIPMLSIVTPTYEAVKRKGLRKVLWLGTAFTMEQPYFRKQFEENGICVVTPEKKERQVIDRIISEELEFGIINQRSKDEINGIIERLICAQDIEAVIFGCTELPLLFSLNELSVPSFDTMKYHIDGIVRFMFGI